MRSISFCLLALAGSALGCGNKATPTPEKEAPKAVSSASPIASSSSASPIPTAPKEIPTFTMEELVPGGKHLNGAFAIEGALMAVEGLRVGRVVGDRVEWIDKTVPDLGPAVGGSHIVSVHGRWPDAVDVIYASNHGRAPMPSYYPLTGKGIDFTFQPGGGAGFIAGLAWVGDTLMLAGYSGQDSYQFVPVRGPKLVRHRQTPAEAGCKKDEVHTAPWNTPTALPPDSLGSTRAGTLMSFGYGLCQNKDERGAAIEVWDKTTGKSRIVPLKGFAKDFGYGVQFMRAPGEDELWVFSDVAGLVLHYVNDDFEVLPKLERPFTHAFVSSKGVLHASDGSSIHRFEDGKWTLVAHLPWQSKSASLLMDENDAFWYSFGGVYKLKPGSKVAYHDGCTTPFVFLYDVSADNARDFTFPTTRKALSTFAGVAEIGLVEFNQGGRRLGIEVKSKEQGEAVIAHIKANMKGEQPTLLCYEPHEPRKIDIKAGK